MSRRNIFLSVAILLLSICASSYAAWTEPIFLSELNTADRIADYPTVSNDGTVIFYTRDIEQPSFYLWESRLNPETGMYENERRVAELGPDNGDFSFVWWISEDLNRMYSSLVTNNGNNALFLVARRTDGTLFQHGSFSELQRDRIIHFSSLTTDELNIMFIARGSGTTSKIFTASRTSVLEKFTNLREAIEFAGIGANDRNMRAYMSRDGLSVYFDKMNDEGFYNIWTGTRESLDEPFGNFEPLSEVINVPGSKSLQPCLADNGKTLYFVKITKGLGAALNGIHVSYWAETPYATAVRVTKEAIAEKETIIEQLDATIAKENEAMEALDVMIESGEYEGMSKQEVLKARKNIFVGIRKQENARRMLAESLDDLRISYSILAASNCN